MDTDCGDCGVNTWILGEEFMIRPKLWKQYGNGLGVLCLGCLENRLGRFTHSGDYTEAPINRDIDFRRSPRLKDRLSA